MRGDFSRIASHPGRAYRQVLLQQGRVLLDADFNEQGAIGADGLRRLTRDLLGPHAGPAGALGFAIGVENQRYSIGWGRYYVDGRLAVNEPPVGAGGATPPFYETQAGFPFPGAVGEDYKPNTALFFYLDVWERTVSWLEDPSLIERALGGADTALRRELVWQVRALKRPKTFKDSDAAGDWLAEHVARHPPGSGATGARLPLMSAWVDPADDADDTPCVADPTGGYSGLENQLYRVEIHAAPDDDDQAGTGELTFKWSRDNASVVAAWTGHSDDDLAIEGVRDTARGFSPGQWVELTDKRRELRGVPGVLVLLKSVEPGRLIYDRGSTSEAIPDLDELLYPIVRRWDHRDRKELRDGAIVLHEDEDYALERGINVRFPKQDGTNPRRYAVGDYWMFPARTATAGIEWPDGPRMPDGIEHAYAPLGHGAQTAPGIKSLQRTINQLWTAV